MKLISLKELSKSVYRVYYYNGVIIGEISPLEDGYYHYWPISIQGCWSAEVMREIANTLDEMNKEWDAELNTYHQKEIIF